MNIVVTSFLAGTTLAVFLRSGYPGKYAIFNLPFEQKSALSRMCISRCRR
jgi:hypothetical protein